jgi:hypothetical protein
MSNDANELSDKSHLMHFIESNGTHQTVEQGNKLLFLEEKLRKADEVLRESAIEIKNLREERE